MVLEQGEVILLILATGVFVWLLANRKYIAKMEHSIFLEISYYILYVGFCCTVAEGIFLGELLNKLEHICYASSMLLVAYWNYKMFGNKENQ
jgi:hypothetical protein